MNKHYEESLNRDIDLISRKITEMGALAERALKRCLRALGERNRQLAYSVILRDQRIDELEKEIDRLCLEFIVCQQPVAGTLRFAYATIKINLELERVGDYAESIARQILNVCGTDTPFPKEPSGRIAEIANLAIPMLHDSVSAFVNQNPELARKAMAAEESVDRLRHRSSAELVQALQQGKLPIETFVSLTNIINRFERVADQAMSICQEALYAYTGEYTKHPGTDVFRVLFVDQHNACRSQLAEAAGHDITQPKFVFASAGLQPKNLDPGTIAFLRDKGIDISQKTPRAVSQVPNIEHFQVIVALSEEARQAFPDPPTKVVCLDWSVRDPSTVTGSPAEVRAAYQETYDILRAHLRDLVEAILGDPTA
jgi:phosphate transport system protein